MVITSKYNIFKVKINGTLNKVNVECDFYFNSRSDEKSIQVK